MKEIKVFFTAVFSALLSWLGILAVPVLLLVGCNLIDYGTGLAAAKYRNEKISSYKGVHGIFKKVGTWLVVLIGAFVDIMLNYAIETAGIEFTIPFVVATVVAVWLVINEIISILENLVDIGVSLPPFLLPLLKQLKTKVEDKGKEGIEEKKEE